MQKKILFYLFMFFFCLTLTGLVQANKVPATDQVKKLPAWKSLGPGGGNITDLAVYEKKPDVVYVRSFRGLFFRSINGGKTWSNMSFVNDGLYQSTAVDQKNQNIVYVAGGTSIFKSKDGGKTWKEYEYQKDSSSTQQNNEDSEILSLWFDIAIDPLNTQNIYTTGSSRLYSSGKSYMAVGRSTDSGETWKVTKLNANSDSGLTKYSSLCKSAPSNIYVGGYYIKAAKQYNVVYGSANGGGKWDMVGEFDDDVTAVAVNPNNPNNVLVGTLRNVHRSSNGGKSWKKNEDSASATAIAFNPDNPDIIYSSSWGRFYKSTNGGRNWIEIPTGNIGNCEQLHVIPGAKAQMTGELATDDIIYFVGNNGFFKSIDGGLTFVHQSQGMNAAGIESISIDPAKGLTLYAGFRNYGFYTGKKGGKKWLLTKEFNSFEDIKQIWVNPNNPDEFLALVERVSSKYMIKSFDRGKNWERISEDDVNYFLVDPNDPDVILAFGRFAQGTKYYMGMYKSTDGGNSWKSKKISKMDGEAICAALSPNGNTIYVGGKEGQGYDQKAALYQSLNNGQSWKKLSIPSSDKYSVNAICIDPNTPAYVYAGIHYGGVIRSSDSGATWMNSTTSFNVKALIMAPKNPKILIAGGHTGINCSTDRGETWKEANGGLIIPNITCFTVNPKKNFIYAGTDSAGVYLNKKLLRKLK